MTFFSTARADGFGMVAVMATYVYFLLYAQFGFIHALNEAVPGAGLVQPAMASMGAAGLAASLVAGALLRRVAARRMLAAGFLGAGMTAPAAMACASPAGFLFLAASVGACTALMTVALAADLRSFIRGGHAGLKVGAATGLAYFICNVPALFEGGAALQGAGAAAFCLAGAFGAMCLPAGRGCEPLRTSNLIAASDAWGWGFAGVVLSFLALVWLDSAAFAAVQDTAFLKETTWATPAQKWIMGGTHLLAAIAAGWMVDRGRLRSVLVGTFFLFAAALPSLRQGGLAGPAYAAGISFYSVCLVLYPSARADEAGCVPARWRAAILYGVAGWIGSALGVGMAQELHRVPPAFVAGAGAAIGCAAALASARMRRTLHVFKLPLAAGAAATALYAGWPGGSGAASDASPVARGRGVYIEEGCINCHSQFLRPGTEDVERWGPHRDVDFDEAPPLIGNRRQGPDLMNVGNRRGVEWQRAHLLAPGLVSPGSRMPSYRHLFDGGSTRGEDLVAYLMSLGEESLMEHVAQAAAWQPRAVLPGSADRGKTLFERSCASCHGPDGAGDGPLASVFNRPAANLRKGPFWFVAQGLEPDAQAVALARIVKYGLPGSPMAGHEYFSDADVSHVVAYLQAMAGRER